MIEVQRCGVTRARMFRDVHRPSCDVTESFTYSVRVVRDNAVEDLTATSTVSGSGSRRQCNPSLFTR
jgi:hypothetical protein